VDLESTNKKKAILKKYSKIYTTITEDLCEKFFAVKKEKKERKKEKHLLANHTYNNKK
jgi:hypothetical protein